MRAMLFGANAHRRLPASNRNRATIKTRRSEKYLYALPQTETKAVSVRKKAL
jgi:hypothetical protein